MESDETGAGFPQLQKLLCPATSHRLQRQGVKLLELRCSHAKACVLSTLRRWRSWQLQRGLLVQNAFPTTGDLGFQYEAVKSVHARIEDPKSQLISQMPAILDGNKYKHCCQANNTLVGDRSMHIYAKLNITFSLHHLRQSLRRNKSGGIPTFGANMLE